MEDVPEDVATMAGEVVAEQMKNNPAFTIYDIAAAAIMADRHGNHEAPEGWKLVPMEPTQDMCDAGEGFNLRCGCPQCDHDAAEKAAAGYRAMLAVAPSPPTVCPFDRRALPNCI